MARVSSDALDAGRLTTIIVARNGGIVLADSYDMTLVVLDASGRRIRTLGSRGSGPSQFTQITSLAWIGDTLAVLDAGLRRLSFFRASDWQLLNTVPWTSAGRPLGLLSSGPTLLSVSGRNEGARRPSGGMPGTVGRTVRYFAKITPHSVGPEMSGLRDATGHRTGSDCEDRRGTVHILAPLFPQYGEMRAVLPDGRVAIAYDTAYRVDIASSGRGISRVLMRPGARPRPVSDAEWDRIAKPYVAAQTANGDLRCTPPFTRPLSHPIIRAVFADDEGQLWIESVTNDGHRMQVFRPDGLAVMEFDFPAVGNAPYFWSVRRGRLYLLRAGLDDLQEVHVYQPDL